MSKIRVRISSTFSVLRPFSYLRPFLYFDPPTLLRPKLYFDLYFSTNKMPRFDKRSKYRNGRRYENGRSTEKVELMRTPKLSKSKSRNEKITMWKIFEIQNRRRLFRQCRKNLSNCYLLLMKKSGANCANKFFTIKHF